MKAEEELRQFGAQMVADGKRLQAKEVRINEVVEILGRYGLRICIDVCADEKVTP